MSHQQQPNHCPDQIRGTSVLELKGIVNDKLTSVPSATNAEGIEDDTPGSICLASSLADCAASVGSTA